MNFVHPLCCLFFRLHFMVNFQVILVQLKWLSVVSYLSQFSLSYSQFPKPFPYFRFLKTYWNSYDCVCLWIFSSQSTSLVILMVVEVQNRQSANILSYLSHAIYLNSNGKSAKWDGRAMAIIFIFISWEKEATTLRCHKFTRENRERHKPWFATFYVK